MTRFAEVSGFVALGGAALVWLAVWAVAYRVLRSHTRTRCFVSYRRQDERDFADRLHSDLALHIGGDHVFIDHNIEPGDSYPDVLVGRLGSCDAVVVVVGPDWPADRLWERMDWVRHEIEAGLKKRCIVVTVDGAELPPSLPRDLLPGRPEAKRAEARDAPPEMASTAEVLHFLPPELEPLRVKQRIDFARTNPDYGRSLGRLVSALERRGRARQMFTAAAWGLTLVVGLAALGLAGDWVAWQNEQAKRPAAPEPKPQFLAVTAEDFRDYLNLSWPASEKPTVGKEVAWIVALHRTYPESKMARLVPVCDDRIKPTFAVDAYFETEEEVVRLDKSIGKRVALVGRIKSVAHSMNRKVVTLERAKCDPLPED